MHKEEIRRLRSVDGDAILRFLQRLEDGCKGYGWERGCAICLCMGEGGWDSDDANRLPPAEAAALIHTDLINRKVISGSQEEPNISYLQLTSEGNRILALWREAAPNQKSEVANQFFRE